MKHQHHEAGANLAGVIVISAPVWGMVAATAVKAAITRRKKARRK